MKHGVRLRKLGRNSAHRWSMLRTMVSQLVQHERIETTLPRAKELRRLAEKAVTLGKEDTLHARRKAAAIVRGDGVMHKLFTEFAERYRDRTGGYTRILQTRRRPNDCAQMAYIEYVDRAGELRKPRPPRPQSLLPLIARDPLESSAAMQAGQ